MRSGMLVSSCAPQGMSASPSAVAMIMRADVKCWIFMMVLQREWNRLRANKVLHAENLTIG